jgi:hypothetical protein
MKNRELIFSEVARRFHDERDCPRPRLTGPSDRVSIPIYPILEYLDWDDRFRHEGSVREFTTNFDATGLLSSWIVDRLMHESYLATYDDPDDWQKYFVLRDSIVRPLNDGRNRDMSCILKTSFTADNTAIESVSSSSSYDIPSPRVLSDDSDDSSEDACDDKDTHRSFRTRRLMHRLSQPSRPSIPYQLVYSPRTHSVTGLVHSSQSRVYKYDHFLANTSACITRDMILQFINGRSYCVVLTGHESSLFESLQTIALRMIEECQEPVERRSNSLNPDVFQCDVKLSLIRFFRNKMDVIWSSNCFSDQTIFRDQMDNMRGLTGHLAFELNLNFRFTKPFIGEHSSRFVVCIPSQPERSRRGLSLDLLALKNCLRAIKSDAPFVPSRDSLLTQWLDLKRFDNIHLITAVNDSTDTSRLESLNGLRFAEQLT